MPAATWREQVEADWLRQDAKRSPTAPGAATCEEDAGGAVDGVKDGKWGFHTSVEKDPWWQVDLGRPLNLDHLVIYNRCDGFAERNSRLMVLLSSDGRQFRRAYQHGGTVFYGAADGKPLTVKLDGAEARFVRLALEGQSYLHLDEVEAYAVGGERNIALGKPAAQSSVSEWSAKHAPANVAPPRKYPIALAVERGLKLAESQRRLGAKVNSHIATLHQVTGELQGLPTDAPDAARRSLYFRTRWAIREMALANPLLGFDTLLFVKRAPTMFPHMSDQFYGWWSRPGGGVCVLSGFKSGEPQVRCLTSDMPIGNFMGPDLSFDGKKLLFAACTFHPELADERNKADKSRVPEDAFYHIFQMNIDGSGRRQLTHGKYDDFDPRYLPGGDIVFLSTRKGTAVQCSQWFSDATRTADRPDSYVRCGGDNYRPVPVFTLHAMDAAGTNLRPLSAFENFEWAPSVADDGRILYTRWDYIDRFNGHFFSLWSANQDGTNPQLVYGNYTVKPQVKLEARSIPGSSKLVFTASAHHSICGGTLCLLDRNRGTEGDAPLTRLTPEVPFPETEANGDHYYANPWPLSEEYFLVGWADQKLPPHCRVTDQRNPPNAMGLYLLDAFGNQELICRDPEISCVSPIPIAPRPQPPTQPAVAALNNAQEGRLFVQDVYIGLDGVPRGSVKQLRLVAVVPKVQPQMNTPVLGISAEDPGKFVLGTVPVEPDGSAYFRVPSGLPLFFQALDASGAAVQTMRTLTYAMPGQTLACVGCHEHRDSTPPAGKPALAVLRQPSKPTPGPAGSWPLRFDQLVQPVLDRHCLECHRADGKDAEAAKLNLAPTNAYQALLAFGNADLKAQAFERDRSVPNQAVAASSKLWKLLTQPDGHQKVKLDADSLSRLATWMDTYAHRLGSFSEQQERELVTFRHDLSPLLSEP
ncbi:MAG: discoidin domain-containing protein [Verrucomicrobia bacterium]|nr:discoidin domain-containing protein [Verrucomicrobiota bacterium]